MHPHESQLPSILKPSTTLTKPPPPYESDQFIWDRVFSISLLLTKLNKFWNEWAERSLLKVEGRRLGEGRFYYPVHTTGTIPLEQPEVKCIAQGTLRECQINGSFQIHSARRRKKIWILYFKYNFVKSK